MYVEECSDEVWVGVKCQSNAEQPKPILFRGWGLWGWPEATQRDSLVGFRTGLERPARAGESPVGFGCVGLARTRVPRDTRNLVGIWEDHLLRLNTLRHR